MSAPWYQFQAPDGVGINSTIEPTSLQNTSYWPFGSYPPGSLTSGMDDGLHSSMLSIPTTYEGHNISEESSNPIPGSIYKSISMSSPEIAHDPVRVDDVFWDVTWDNIFFNASFDHGSVSSSVPRAWTPTSVSIY
jgi:hypothetical protein